MEPLCRCYVKISVLLNVLVSNVFIDNLNQTGRTIYT